MYFEFESIQTSSTSLSSNGLNGFNNNNNNNNNPLTRRHRLLSSSSHSIPSLNQLNRISQENISPTHCNLYLITRKKLSSLSTNSHDLRKEVLLSTLHRNFTSDSLNTLSSCSNSSSQSSTSNYCLQDLNTLKLNEDKRSTAFNKDLSSSSYLPSTIPTSTNTVTMASNRGTNLTINSTNTVVTSSSSLKKRSSISPSSSPPTYDYEDEWKTTIKRIKVFHGFNNDDYNMMMDDDVSDDRINKSVDDLNELTTDFHRLKTPFI